MGKSGAPQPATGEYPEEGNGTYRPSAAVAPEGLNQLSFSTGDKRHIQEATV